MIPYLILFFVVALQARKANAKLGWFLLLWIVLMIGLRHEVGGDWSSYISMFDRVASLSFSEVLSESDPGYALLNKLSDTLGWSYYGANLLSAWLFGYGLWHFCRAQSLPMLALAVAIPYLVIVVAMGYTRQGVAIGLGMLALLSLERQQWLRFVGWVLLAATFHKTAVVLLGLALAISGGSWWWRLPLMSVVALFAYQSILATSINNYMLNYEEAGYQSQGAAIRVAMNALPALLFLRWQRAMSLTPTQRSLWRIMSYAALLMGVALMLANSSTAVDRLALYLIPLQLFVWSRMPVRFGRLDRRWIGYVLLYSLAVLLTWLLFAGHAFAWLPYKFYPLVWLFS